MKGRAIPGAYLFRLYVCDKEMSWPHHIGETHQPDWVVYVRNSEKFRLTNVIPERIIFVSRGITVHYCLCQRLQWNRSDWNVISPDCLAPTKWVCFELTVWPDTCCSVHRIRVLLQWTKRIWQKLFEICGLFGTKETKITITEISSQNFGMKQERN